MSNAKDLLIRLLVDDDEVTRKVPDAANKLDRLSSATGKGAAAGMVALGGLAAGAIASGNAAAEAEQSTTQLQFALDQFPATADTNAERLMELNSALALKTQYDDDAIASGQAVLAQFGITGSQLEQMTPLLLDYAAKTGQDVPAAAEALGKGLMGQGRALKAIGIEMTDSGSVAGNYEQIMAGLTSQVDGFAAAQGETAQGSMSIMNNAIGEIAENLGQAFLPMMTEGAQALAGFATWAAENSDLIGILATGVGVIAGALVAAHGVVTAFTAVQAIQTAAQWASNAAWLASPVTWIVLAIIAAIAILVATIWLLWSNWDNITKWLGEAMVNVGVVVMDTLGAIGDWWNGLMQSIGNGVAWIGERVLEVIGFFGDIGRNIGGGFEEIGRGLLEVGHGIATAFAWLWNNTIGAVSIDIPGAFGMPGIKFDVPDIVVPALALGGIVTGPTLALIGEAGPEAVVPLSRGADYGMGGGGDTIVHSVTKIGERVVFEAYERHKRKRR